MRGAPVVALESTIIAHGMPYPQNVETARAVEDIVRAAGAVPATIAIIGGALKVGLTPDELDRFGRDGRSIAKVSVRDLPFIVAQKLDGATTVASTMRIAAMAGIHVFATGGIGGVHRGAEKSFDISADMTEFAASDVAVVTAGAKAILDLALTLETLETLGVPVIGLGTDEFPAFYSRQSGHAVPMRCDSAGGGGGRDARQVGDGAEGRARRRQSHSGRCRNSGRRDRTRHRGGGEEGGGHRASRARS